MRKTYRSNTICINSAFMFLNIWNSLSVTDRPEKETEILRGLRPGSKVCSENMNDLHNLSQGGLEQNEFSPKVNLEVFLCLNV